MLIKNDQVSSTINERLGRFSGLTKTTTSMMIALMSNTKIEKIGLDLFWGGIEQERNKQYVLE